MLSTIAVNRFMPQYSGRFTKKLILHVKEKMATTSYRVHDFDAITSALKCNGTRFRSKPIRGPGGKQVLGEDPSGNPVELFEAKRE